MCIEQMRLGCDADTHIQYQLSTWNNTIFYHNVLIKTIYQTLKFSRVMCSGSEAGSFLTLMNPCITQLEAQGPSRTCNESKEEREECDGDSSPHL